MVEVDQYHILVDVDSGKGMPVEQKGTVALRSIDAQSWLGLDFLSLLFFKEIHEV